MRWPDGPQGSRCTRTVRRTHLSLAVADPQRGRRSYETREVETCGPSGSRAPAFLCPISRWKVGAPPCERRLPRFDLRPFCVVARPPSRSFSTRLKRLENCEPRTALRSFSHVSRRLEHTFVWSARPSRLAGQHITRICRSFYGSDGTRTRDLRRDRPGSQWSAGTRAPTGRRPRQAL
jgi:hypothetical protein